MEGDVDTDWDMVGDDDDEKDAADDTEKHADCEITLDADTVGEGSEDEID